MTLIKDAGKNSDGYEAKVKETASLQGRFFVVGQLVSEFPSPFPDNNLFFVQAKSSSVGTEMRGTFNPKQRPLASETPIRNPV